MASDLPEFRHVDGHSMARVLVTYIDDAQRIRDLVHGEFGGGTFLSLTTIHRLRASYLASKNKPQSTFKAHEGYYPADVSDRMALTSKEFLARLERERANSVQWAVKCGILDSPALRDLGYVDKAWETEVEQAKREAEL